MTLCDPSTYTCGDAAIEIEQGADGTYMGVITAPVDANYPEAGTARWEFDGVRPGAVARDEEREAVRAALSFGTYYTSHNRGDDVPGWAPDPDTADALEAAAWDYGEEAHAITDADGTRYSPV